MNLWLTDTCLNLRLTESCVSLWLADSCVSFWLTDSCGTVADSSPYSSATMSLSAAGERQQCQTLSSYSVFIPQSCGVFIPQSCGVFIPQSCGVFIPLWVVCTLIVVLFVTNTLSVNRDCVSVLCDKYSFC